MDSISTYFNSLLASLTAFLAHKYDALVHAGMPIFFWVRPRWKEAQISDQSGKIVIVTGGNSGTGYSTCKALYEHGATVYLACRSEQKAREAVENIEKGGVFGYEGLTFPSDGGVRKGKGRLEYMQLDLADLSSIETFAEEFSRREEQLDILFANAGVMASPRGMYTKQGYTLQFGTNTLGHHRLITLLLPKLLKSSSAHSDSPSRIIITSSAGHSAAPKGGIDLSSVKRLSNSSGSHHSNGANGEGVEGKLNPGKNELMTWIEYGQSKWGNIACVKWLDRVYGPRSKRSSERIGNGEIISIAVHPGCVATQLARHISVTPYIIKWFAWMVRIIVVTPTEGASNQLWASTCPVSEARNLSGEYIVPFQRIGVARPDLNNVKRVNEIWEWMAKEGSKNA